MALFDTYLNKTSSTGVAPGVITYYERALLENVEPDMVHARDAQKRSLPEHNGKTVQFRKFTPFSAVTTPLSEGSIPNGQTLTQTQIFAMVKPFGAHVELTDEMQFYMIDNMHKETADLLAKQASLSLDTITRNAIITGSNVQYITGDERSDIAATNILTFAEIKKAVRTLKRNNAPVFEDGFYHGIVHPDVVYDLTSDSRWTAVDQYQDKSKVEKYELGNIYGVKFFESTNAYKLATDDSYVYGTTAELTLASNFSATDNSCTVTATITADEARELTGKLVSIYASALTPDYQPICVDRVDVANSKIYFRWCPTEYATMTTGNSTKIRPLDAGSGGADIYATLIYGKDAFGIVSLGGSGRNVNVYINAPGSAGAMDPLHQFATIAWKVNGFTATILQDAFMVKLITGATA